MHPINSLFSKSFYKKNSGVTIIVSLAFYLMISIVQKAAKYYYSVDVIQPFVSLIKLLFLLFFVVVLAINYRIVKSLLIYLLVYLVIYLIGNFNMFSDNNFDFYKSISDGNFFYFNKYLYPFIFIGVVRLSENSKKTTDLFFKIIEMVLLINAFFIFIGLLCSIDYFQSYPKSLRFGYSGLLDRIFLVNFSVIIISRWVFIKKMDWKLCIICLGALLSGTKLIILYFAILAIFYCYYKKKVKGILFLSSILVLIIVFYKEVIIFMAELFPFWQRFLIKKEYLTLILSQRDLNWNRAMGFLVEHGTCKNLLVGGVEFPTYLVEMDFVDLFLFFGVFGGVLYLYLLSNIINKGYHLIPLLSTFFVGGFLLGTITMCAYLLWCYESNPEKINYLTKSSKRPY